MASIARRLLLGLGMAVAAGSLVGAAPMKPDAPFTFLVVYEDDGTVAYYGAAPRNGRQVVTVWNVNVFYPARQRSAGLLAYGLFTQEYDCDKRSAAMRYGWFFDPHGRQIDETAIDSPPKPPGAGSYGEYLFEVVCQGAKPRREPVGSLADVLRDAKVRKGPAAAAVYTPPNVTL